MMDPFYKPVMTLIEPFIVHKYSERREDNINPRFPPEARKSFDFNAKHMSALLTEKNLLAGSTKQMNCVV
jgi:hypothetical protein